MPAPGELVSVLSPYLVTEGDRGMRLALGLQQAVIAG
jgi:hypothetical protein